MTDDITGALIGTLIGLAIGLVFIFIFAAIFRWLWNTTMPEVFGIKAVSFAQAIKILLLASILFGGHRVVDTTPPYLSEPEAGQPDIAS